jgi:hypothetical protein
VFRITTFSEAGGHATNEDAFVAAHLPGNPDGVLVCVADGQGGYRGGAKAARLACEFVAAKASSELDVLGRADVAVSADPEAGFTTLIGFVVFGDTVTGASCGDSTVVAVCSSGEITEPTRLQFKNPPVGSGEAVFIPFGAELRRPWKLLAMTDGVWKYVGWQRLREAAGRLGGEELIEALKAAGRMPGSGQFQDDFTLVLLEADGP